MIITHRQAAAYIGQDRLDQIADTIASVAVMEGIHRDLPWDYQEEWSWMANHRPRDSVRLEICREGEDLVYTLYLEGSRSREYVALDLSYDGIMDEIYKIQDYYVAEIPETYGAW